MTTIRGGEGAMWQIRTGGAALAMASLLSGCAAVDTVTRGLSGGPGLSDMASSATPALNPEQADGSRSAIISDLLRRDSVLPPGSSFAVVSDAVLSANSRAAEVDLRAAKLRSEARARNWLPSLGPTVSLTSLGEVVTGLLIEQVLFDGGRRAAERAFARADVEVAATALAIDTNERVHDALSLYLDAQQADDRVRVAEVGLGELDHFDYVLGERVAAGVSDRADLQVLQSRIASIHAAIVRDRDAVATAMAELEAMSARPLTGLSGIPDAEIAGAAEPLTTVKARAESGRALAEAQAARAGFFPRLTLGGDLTSGDAGVTGGTETGIGFGMGANLAAIEAESAASTARVAQARETAARALASMRQQLDGVTRQIPAMDAAADAETRSLELFRDQYLAGQRPVLDVIGVYEGAVAARTEARALRYDAARLRLGIARDLGLLVDGDRI